MTTIYRVADDVAWVSQDDLDDGSTPMAYATLLPTGRPVILEGSACLAWLAIVEGGTLDQIVSSTAQLADLGPAAISGDVRALIDSLLAAGLVQEG